MSEHDWADWTPEDAYREGREESADEIARLQAEIERLQSRLDAANRLRIYTDVEVESFRWSDEGDPGWIRSDDLEAALKGDPK